MEAMTAAPNSPLVEARDVPPEAYFVEERRLPGSSTKQGELRRNYFRRTETAELVIVNGAECIEVLAYGFTQEQLNRKVDVGVPCRIFAITPVKLENWHQAEAFLARLEAKP